MAFEVDWREPPPSMEDQLKAELKKNPGRWARVKTNLASITAGSPWRKEGFEVHTHRIAGSDPRKFDIYARWPAVVGLPLPTPNSASQPATANKTNPVTNKSGVPSKPKPPADGSDLIIPTSRDVTGGYLVSRASRAVPAKGESGVRVVGHNPSPVRP